jgi:hypothetical protein
MGFTQLYLNFLLKEESFLFSMVQQPIVDQGLLITEDSQSNSRH